jgi:outer membrane protein TolC
MRLFFLSMLLMGCATAPRPWDAPWPKDAVPYVPPESRSAVSSAVPRTVSEVVPQAVQGRFPIDLPTVLRLAGANNLDIAFVREKVHEAYARTQLVEEQLWPMLGPEFTFRRHGGLTQATEGTFLDVDKQQTFAGLRAGLRWDVGEAIFSTLAASRRYEGAQATLEATRENVLLEAAQTYYDLVREHLREQVAVASAGVSEKLAGEIEVSVRAGRGFQGDVLRARVQHSLSRLEILRAREGIKVAELRVSTLLRLSLGIELFPVEGVPAPLTLVDPGVADAEILQEALERRAEIKVGLREVEASRREKEGAAWGPLIPTIVAEASPGGLGPVLSDLKSTEDYGVSVQWRFGAGGLFDFARYNLTQAKTRQAEIDLGRIRQGVTEQLMASLVQLRAKDEQMKLAESAIKDAEESLKLNQERQAGNIGLPLEVLQAEEALARARLNFYTAVVEYNQAQLRAFTYSGRKHSAEKLPAGGS